MLPSHMQAGTMYPKLQTLWDDIPQVSDDLYKKKKLTTLYNTNMPQQMAKITMVTIGGIYSEIVRDLLKTSLIRNQGIHLSLRGFDREELFQLLEVILRSAVLMWKHAKTRRFI
jgi:hypothetical protein